MINKKIKTAYKLFKHTPKNLSSISNFINSVKYNTLPSNLKQTQVNHKPISISIYINTICNYRCKFCFLINEDHIGTKKKNISIEQFNKIINHKNNIGVSRVTLGGGEPLLHKNFFDFVNILNENNKIISVYTNGSLINRNFEQMAKAKIDYINISHYDEHFFTIKDHIKELKNKNKYAKVRISKIISNEDYKKMEELIEESIALNLDRVIFQNYFPYRENEIKLTIYDDNKKYQEYVKYLKNKFLNKIEIVWPSILQRNGKFNCQNISLTATYDADGFISPCCFIVPPEEKFGNLDDYNFWNNNMFKSLRSQYGSKKKLGNSCDNCYFKHGLSNRYL